MDDPPEERKFVLRAPGQRTDEPRAQGENEDEAPPPVPQTTPAVPTVRSAESFPEDGYLPPVRLDQIRPAPTKRRDPDAEPLERRLGHILLGIGGSLACLLPTLPWFRVTVEVLSASDVDVVPSTAGIRSWAGLACLIGGIVATSCLIAILSPKTARYRRSLGLVAAGIGVAVTLGAIIGSTVRPGVIEATGVVLRTTPWIMLTAAAGICIAVGGLLSRQ